MPRLDQQNLQDSIPSPSVHAWRPRIQRAARRQRLENLPKEEKHEVGRLHSYVLYSCSSPACLRLGNPQEKLVPDFQKVNRGEQLFAKGSNELSRTANGVKSAKSHCRPPVPPPQDSNCTHRVQHRLRRPVLERFQHLPSANILPSLPNPRSARRYLSLSVRHQLPVVVQGSASIIKVLSKLHQQSYQERRQPKNHKAGSIPRSFFDPL